MRWFIPSFHGDIRLEARGAGGCELAAERVTVSESKALEALELVAKKKGWIAKEARLVEGGGSGVVYRGEPVALAAPIECGCSRDEGRDRPRVMPSDREAASHAEDFGGR
ncbi:MAG TPA: hypothetical protein VE987_07715 [Polyangiaceae bacterium]|nr:hypothetical protein [Polyangiaceae bacterium]